MEPQKAILKRDVLQACMGIIYSAGCRLSFSVLGDSYHAQSASAVHDVPGALSLASDSRVGSISTQTTVFNVADLKKSASSQAVVDVQHEAIGGQPQQL